VVAFTDDDTKRLVQITELRRLAENVIHMVRNISVINQALPPSGEENHRHVRRYLLQALATCRPSIYGIPRSVITTEKAWPSLVV
jgi:hypothetical protein